MARAAKYARLVTVAAWIYRLKMLTCVCPVAIGEIMTKRDESTGQLYCIGYSTFANEYKSSPDFRHWFLPIERGIEALGDPRQRSNRASANRLRRLQHLLVDLAQTLDQDGNGAQMTRRGYADAAPGCKCDGCSVSNTVRNEKAGV